MATQAYKFTERHYNWTLKSKHGILHKQALKFTHNPRSTRPARTPSRSKRLARTCFSQFWYGWYGYLFFKLKIFTQKCKLAVLNIPSYGGAVVCGAVPSSKSLWLESPIGKPFPLRLVQCQIRASLAHKELKPPPACPLNYPWGVIGLASGWLLIKVPSPEPQRSVSISLWKQHAARVLSLYLEGPESTKNLIRQKWWLRKWWKTVQSLKTSKRLPCTYKYAIKN